MPFDCSAVQGPYLQDLLDQPAAVGDTVAGLRAVAPLPPPECRRIVLTGMGGSFASLHPLNFELIEAGFTPVMVETSELLYAARGLLDAGTLVIALSQSGASAETLRLLDIASRCPVIGITNTPGSPLAARATHAILTHAGAEFSVSSKTVLASLVALGWLGACFCGSDPARRLDELEQAVPALASYLARWREHMAALADELAGVRDVFFIGRGASLAAAGIGGLTIKEAAHFHSESMSSAAFRHGPFEMLNPEMFVLVLEGEPSTAHLNRGLADDIRKAGGRVALAAPDATLEVFRLPAVRPAARPIVEMLPVQMISVALGGLAGREPGRFERLTKVTTVE